MRASPHIHHFVALGILNFSPQQASVVTAFLDPLLQGGKIGARLPLPSELGSPFGKSTCIDIFAHCRWTQMQLLHDGGNARTLLVEGHYLVLASLTTQPGDLRGG
jgi:hypothetical protein